MKILEKLLGKNTLYYPGCLTKFVAKNLEEDYKKILTKLGVDFIVLKDKEVCCGSPALKAGYANDFCNLAQKNLQLFREHGIGKIISNCPACTMIFKKEYPKILQDWNIEVFHISEIINKRIKFFKTQKRIRVSYHDPCHLGRELGIYDPPREIIKKMGYHLVEMEFSFRDSFCCGGGGGVVSNEPELANKIAQQRIEQAKNTNVEMLITSCPLCYLHLKQNSKDLMVKELSEIIEF